MTERSPSPSVARRRVALKDASRRLVPALVRPHKGERDGGAGQHGGEPNRALRPLQEDRNEPPARAEHFADPAENAALLRPSRGKFGGHERHGDQEEHGGEHVVEDEPRPYSASAGSPDG